jgi:hypothetical protein
VIGYLEDRRRPRQPTLRDLRIPAYPNLEYYLDGTRHVAWLDRHLPCRAAIPGRGSFPPTP